MSDIFLPLPIEQRYDFNGSIAKMEFNRLKEILEKHFNLKMVASCSCPNNKNYHIEVYYSEDGSEEDLVAYVGYESPEKALSCIINRLSGSTFLVYKETHTNNTFSLLYDPDTEPPTAPLPNCNISLYRTIHIPEFHAAKELEMKLELSA